MPDNQRTRHQTDQQRAKETAHALRDISALGGILALNPVS